MSYRNRNAHIRSFSFVITSSSRRAKSERSFFAHWEHLWQLSSILRSHSRRSVYCSRCFRLIPAFGPWDVRCDSETMSLVSPAAKTCQNLPYQTLNSSPRILERTPRYGLVHQCPTKRIHSFHRAASSEVAWERLRFPYNIGGNASGLPKLCVQCRATSGNFESFWPSSAI